MTAEKQVADVFEVGEVVDNVSLDIDYQIIQHFSQHLYGSPNKAIEELVANGFDAFAKKVYVYLPGKFTSDYILVWDNGNSMNAEGIKHLWLIADSPKKDDERVAKETGLPDRAVIGKFGIGKLASYSIGDEIVHICRRNHQFLLVHVNYGDFLDRHNKSESTSKEKPTSKEKLSKEKPHKSPIRKINKKEARQIIQSLFNTDLVQNMADSSLGVKELFDQEHWTLAIIGKLKKELKHGRLLWLLGNGMPLRPDFEIFVDDEKVESRLEGNAKTVWNFATSEIQKQIQSDWNDAVKDVDIPEINGKIKFGKEVGLNPKAPKENTPFVEFPYLGKIWGDTKLFENPLNDIKAERIGRSYGFFIMVRERLINPYDPQYILSPDPHFGTFYRCQYFLHFKKDEDLLADRERFKQDTAGYKEMRLLLHSLSKATRSKVYEDFEKDIENEKTENLLPIKSSELFRSPISSLLAHTELDEGISFNFTKPEIVREPSGEDTPLSKISPDGKGFIINTSHPYYTVLEERLGKQKKFQPFYQALDLISISELTLQGYLYDIGLSDEKVQQIASWRDELFRQLAENYRRNRSDFAIELKNASYQGDDVFEVALAAILEDMGFKCERDGAIGKKDVLLVATIGTEAYKFIFEAKGSKSAVRNVPAAVASAAAHREAVEGATHAVIVARAFAGLMKDPAAEDRAIMNECKAVPGVSIMTVDALIKLHEAMDEYQYPLNLVKDIFTKLETPYEKLESIEKLQKPTDDFEYKAVLKAIWKKQGDDAEGEFVDVNTIRQENRAWKKAFTEEEFITRVFALATIAGGAIILKSNQKINIRQHPDRIIQLIERRLEG